MGGESFSNTKTKELVFQGALGVDSNSGKLLCLKVFFKLDKIGFDVEFCLLTIVKIGLGKGLIQSVLQDVNLHSWI